MDPDSKPDRPVLVVCASGQLGTRVVRQLVAEGRPVRALVRPTSRQGHLRQAGVQAVHGDPADPASLDAACQGAGPVIANANAVAPLHGSRFAAVEDRGYAALLQAVQRQACGRFVLILVPVTPHDDALPLFRYKRLIERRLPARGDEAAPIHRPWGLLQTFMGAVGGLIEKRGIALVPGPADTRHAFIAVDDVAQVLVAATHPATLNAQLEVGGPQWLSWRDVAALYAQVLGRPVRTVSSPGAVFRAQQWLMRPFSEAASNIMGLNRLASRTLPIADPGPAAALGITPIAAEQFLRHKAALPA